MSELMSELTSEQVTKPIILAIDIETTGLDFQRHEIVELGVIAVDTELNELAKFEAYVRPLHPETASERAMEVNGLDLAFLQKQATPAQVKSLFYDWLQDYFPGQSFGVIGHNYAMFDSLFLRMFFRQELFGEIFNRNVYDTRIIAAELKARGRLDVKGVSLKVLCERFKIERKQAHRALSDARDTVELLKILRKV